MTQPMFLLIYIIPSLIISPILSLSMNSWFLIWMSLEFNLMTFIPVIIFFNKYYKNISMKYFIIQSFSSSMLIICSNMQMINFFENNYINLLMNISLLIKIGTPPFHMWFINLMNNMQWMNCLILSTWQKIIPMIMINYIFNYKMIYLTAILSCLIGATMMINHQSLRLIMSYSSINHMSWLLINLMISENLWVLYFINYSMMNFSIMLILNKFKIFYLNQMLMLNNNKLYKIILLMNFFSISGLPPMFGFMMKWFSIYLMNWNNNMIIIFILVMMSIMTFFFYMRICLLLLIQFNLKIKNMINFKLKNNFKIYNFMIINSFLYLWIMNMWLI